MKYIIQYFHICRTEVLTNRVRFPVALFKIYIKQIQISLFQPHQVLKFVESSSRLTVHVQLRGNVGVLKYLNIQVYDGSPWERTFLEPRTRSDCNCNSGEDVFSLSVELIVKITNSV